MEDYKKKYKEALAQAKQELEACGSLDCDAARQIFRLFPELKKSEDDIFKELFYNLIVANACTPSSKEIFSIYSKTKEDCLAWLEKQGEHKNFTPKSATEAIKEEKIDNANKVEPKFKVGDWIVNNISKDIFLIKSSNSGYCALEDTKGRFYHPCLPHDDEFHLWTVKDAKKGDILQANKCILIFDSLTKDIDGNTVISSWYYCNTKTFYGIGTCKPDLWAIEGVTPATKEQCDFLFAKMKNAGCRWDVKEKKLTKL